MADWILDHFGWIIGVWAACLATLLAGVIWWTAVGMDDWADRCQDAGGVVESRYLGDTVIYVNSGNGVRVPIVTPNYSYHCMVNGQEINV